MTFWFYRAYGLLFQTDRPISQLNSLPTLPEHIDIRVSFTDNDEFVGVDWQPSERFQDQRIVNVENQTASPTGRAILESSGGELIRFCYSDGVFFTVDHNGSEVWIYQPPQASFEYVVSYLMNSVLGFCLRLRGSVCIHASAVMIDDYAVLFSGWSGSGKSTTAGAFALRGHTVIADDICVLEDKAGTFYLQPGYPHVRLWEPSAEALMGDASILPRIAPDWSKQYLDLQNSQFRFAEAPVPLGAIYLLTRRDEPTSISAITPFKALWALMNNTYMHYLLDKTTHTRDFTMLTSLIERVPVRSLVTSRGLDTLPNLYETINSDFRQILG